MRGGEWKIGDLQPGWREKEKPPCFFSLDANAWEKRMRADLDWP